MAVAFDAVGAGGNTAATSTSWSHTATGSNRAVVAAAAFNTLTAPASVAATYGGVSMTQLAVITANNVAAGDRVVLFGLLAPATGAQTVSVSATGGTVVRVKGNSVSFTGVASFGTGVTAFGTTGTALSMAVTAATDGMIAQAFESDGAAALSAYNQTQRYLSSDSGCNLVFGTATGTGSALTFSATQGTSGAAWGGVGVPLVAAAANTNLFFQMF